MRHFPGPAGPAPIHRLAREGVKTSFCYWKATGWIVLPKYCVRSGQMTARTAKDIGAPSRPAPQSETLRPAGAQLAASLPRFAPLGRRAERRKAPADGPAQFRLNFSLRLLDQSVDISIGKTGGDNAHPRFSPRQGQPLGRLDDDRHRFVGTDGLAQQLGGDRRRFVSLTSDGGMDFSLAWLPRRGARPPGRARLR